MAPYTPKQTKFFNTAAHDPEIAREHGMSQKEARKLADEANKLKDEGKEKSAALPLDVIDLAPIFGTKK